jgi:hypothetical protein
MQCTFPAALLSVLHHLPCTPNQILEAYTTHADAMEEAAGRAVSSAAAAKARRAGRVQAQRLPLARVLRPLGRQLLGVAQQRVDCSGPERINRICIGVVWCRILHEGQVFLGVETGV